MDDLAGAAPDRADGYEPPTVTYLGTLSDLTLQSKDVGAADGTVFLGIDIGSV